MTEQIWLALSGAVGGLCAGLIGLALMRLPDKPVARPLHAFVASGVLWAFGDLLTAAATDMFWEQVGVFTLYSGSIMMPAFWWIVALRWAEDCGAELPLRRPVWTWGPLAFAGTMWLTMVTNPWHGAFITPVVGGRNVYQPLWYVMAVPNYALILAALGVELEAARRVVRSDVRRQAAFLIAASLVTLLSNLVYVLGLLPFNGTLLVLSISGALLVVGMARDGLFGVLPAALPTIAADHPDGLVIVGPEGYVRYANARARELVAPLEVRSDTPIHDTLRDPRLRPDSARRLDADAGLWDALASLDGVLFRLAVEPARWLHISGRAVIGRRAQLKGYCLRICDLTAQKQAELHQRQARRLDSVASLARSVSREFQGAFAVIRGNAELLSPAAASGPAQERKLARILDAASYGAGLAQELQLYAGTVDAVRVVQELSEVVEETCGLVESDLPAEVRLTLARTEELLPVDADPVQIRHSIFNLLMNAIEAMPACGGEVLVETGATRLDPVRMDDLVHGNEVAPGAFAFVRIRDEGGGMDAETEERAFEPFFSTRHKDRGNGLSTVLGIARAHDALLALDNEPGRGCVFTLYFPLNLEARAGATPFAS